MADKLSIKVPKYPYVWGFRTSVDPGALDHKILYLEGTKSLEHTPSYLLFDFDIKKAIAQRGSNVSKFSESDNPNISVTVNAGPESRTRLEALKGNKFKITIRSNRPNGGFTSYDLGHAIYLWEKYADPNTDGDQVFVTDIIVEDNVMYYHSNH